MYTTTTINQNPIAQNSVLGAKFLNPDFLFNQLVAILGYVFNAKILELFSFISIF